jgi:hypothetical protein
MTKILEYLKRPVVIGIAGFVVGMIFGLVVLGWLVWPVQWTDAAPEQLHPGYQEIYLRMAIESYAANGDAAAAKVRWDALGEAGPTALAQIKTTPGTLDPVLVNAFEAAVTTGVVVEPQATTLPEGQVPVEGETPVVEEEAGGKSGLVTLLVVMCVLTLLIGGALAAYFIIQGRKHSGAGITTPQMQAHEAAQQAEWTDYSTMGDEAPMAQFMASYRLGDDLFDDSFSIDSPAGEFMGECGVGISETIGVGEPKKVTAFEVWLFDKNDIQTVTKVLMSAHAFADAGIRQRLETKGELVQTDAGSQTVLETATLKLVARIVDMTYGQGALPENSFFESLILELAVWQK